MHRLMFLGLVALAGCQGVVGPVRRGCMADVIDGPCLSPDEQKQRARDQLALPEASRAVGPRTYADNPALKGP